MAIPRAVIYHSVGFDLANLVRSVLPGRARTSPDEDADVGRLEERFSAYMGSRHALAFPYARTGVYAALKAKGIPPGSEIIMPPITIKPMVDVVLALGLKPVFVDLERDTLCFDPAQLEAAITDDTRAILLTYLFGVVPDLSRLLTICRARGLFVIEDFSHNLNAAWEGRKLGTFGDVGVYSCSMTKTLDAYAGGLLVTDDDELLAALRQIQQSLEPAPPGRLTSRVLRDLVWNVATRRWVFSLFVFPLLRILRRVAPTLERKMTGARLGLRADAELPPEYLERFTPFQARVALAMMGKVESEDALRIGNVGWLRARLPEHGHRFPSELDGARNVYWQFVAHANDERKLTAMLARRGIDTGTTNLSLVSGLGLYPEHERSCPVAEEVKRRASYIPVHPRVRRGDLDRLREALKEAFVADTGPSARVHEG